MALAKKATKADAYLKAMLWGEPGSGKTRLALSFPAPLVIDLERGSRLYAEEFDFLLAEPTPEMAGVTVVKTVIDEILRGEYPDRKTLIIDPITDYLDQLEALLIDAKRKAGINLEALKGPLAAKVRAEIKDGIKERLEALLRLPMHIVFVAREKNNWEGSVVNGKRPDANDLVEYLPDVVINLKRGGIAEVQKSRIKALPDKIKAMTFADLEAALAASPRPGASAQGPNPPASVLAKPPAAAEPAEVEADEMPEADPFDLPITKPTSDAIGEEWARVFGKDMSAIGKHLKEVTGKATRGKLTEGEGLNYLSTLKTMETKE